MVPLPRSRSLSEVPKAVWQFTEPPPLTCVIEKAQTLDSERESKIGPASTLYIALPWVSGGKPPGASIAILPNSIAWRESFIRWKAGARGGPGVARDLNGVSENRWNWLSAVESVWGRSIAGSVAQGELASTQGLPVVSFPSTFFAGSRRPAFFGSGSRPAARRPPESSPGTDTSPSGPCGRDRP